MAVGGLGVGAVEQERHYICVSTRPWIPRLNSMEKDVTGKAEVFPTKVSKTQGHPCVTPNYESHCLHFGGKQGLI